MAKFTEDEDRQLGTEQAGYWIAKFQDKGDPMWVPCWILWQIAKVLWRIFDKLEEIRMATDDADDIGKAVAKHLANRAE